MIILASFFSAAQVGVQSDALGRTGVARVSAMESGLLNPAAVAFLDDYYLGVQWHKSALGDQQDLNQYGVTITDALPGSLAAGTLIYRQRDWDLANDQSEQFFFFSLGRRLTNSFSVGVSVYHIQTEPDGFQEFEQTNGDVGLFWQPLKNLQVGARAQAVAGSEEEAINSPGQVLPAVVLGALYQVGEMVHFSFDLHKQHEGRNNEYLDHRMGLELALRADFALRVGWQIDDINSQNRYSLGLGWNGPRLKFGYAFQKEERQGLGESHSVDLFVDF